MEREDMNDDCVVQHGLIEAEIDFLVDHDTQAGRTTWKHRITNETVIYHDYGAWFVKYNRLFHLRVACANNRTCLGRKLE